MFMKFFEVVYEVMNSLCAEVLSLEISMVKQELNCQIHLPDDR